MLFYLFSVFIHFVSSICFVRVAEFVCLRNRLPVGGGCVYILQLFFFVFFVFLFFPTTKTMRQPFSGTAERIFRKLSPNNRGECSLKRRATAWRKSCHRLANGECWWFAEFTVWLFHNHQRAPRNLRYDSCGITRGRHRRLRYTTMSGRIDVI